MDILAFIYYMLYSVFYKMGQFISRNSPFVVNKDARHTNKNIDISVTNTTNAFYMLGVALYSMDIYIYIYAILWIWRVAARFIVNHE